MVKPHWELIVAPKGQPGFIFRVSENRDGQWYAGQRSVNFSVDLTKPEVVEDLIKMTRMSPVQERPW